MTLVELVVFCLACFRISHMLANDTGNDDGPYLVLSRLRHWIGVRYDKHSIPYGTNELSKGTLCVFCNSIWVGLVITILYAILGSVTVFIFLPFALSGIVVLIELIK